MIFDNISDVLDSIGRNNMWTWTYPDDFHAPQLDHRVAQLEATVAAQARELNELRLALKGVMAALQCLEGDGR